MEEKRPRPVASRVFHVFEHMSATTAVRAKTISARAACGGGDCGREQEEDREAPEQGLRKNRDERNHAEQPDRFPLSKKNSMAISRPTNVETAAATRRWPCSKRMPPTIGGMTLP